MKKHAGNIWISILFLAGFSLLLYPMAANEWNNYRQTQLIGDYDEILAQKEQAGTLDYQAEKEAAVSYNEALLPSILPDSFAVAEASGGCGIQGLFESCGKRCDGNGGNSENQY